MLALLRPAACSSLFFANFLILFGPLSSSAIQQIKGYEPGDADWGVKLADVRGQAEAKEEITRVVSLWQSGEEFEKAGGKRERGVLFLGAPGTGKTMLSKAIATSFNCPFVTIPGSGFAQTFIGMDAVLVRYLARKAKKLAAKWGGQCIVFIDEIDAVGMRRASLGSGFQPLETRHDPRRAVLRPEGRADLGRRPRARDRRVARPAVRDARRAAARASTRALVTRSPDAIRDVMIPGGMGGGRRAGAQPAARRDGRHRRAAAAQEVAYASAVQHVPRRALHRPAAASSAARCGCKPPKPRKEEIYFIGACNVPLEALDPALTRPGRMGRHIYFRTPTWEDRRDIFDLYLDKVAHEEDARHAEGARRARPHHQRLLAGDDRPGLLAGADLRALRRAPGVLAARTSSRR